jgi:hypothetical protein
VYLNVVAHIGSPYIRVDTSKYLLLLLLAMGDTQSTQGMRGGTEQWAFGPGQSSTHESTPGKGCKFDVKQIQPALDVHASNTIRLRCEFDITSEKYNKLQWGLGVGVISAETTTDPKNFYMFKQRGGDCFVPREDLGCMVTYKGYLNEVGYAPLESIAWRKNDVIELTYEAVPRLEAEPKRKSPRPPGLEDLPHLSGDDGDVEEDEGKNHYNNPVVESPTAASNPPNNINSTATSETHHSSTSNGLLTVRPPTTTATSAMSALMEEKLSTQLPSGGDSEHSTPQKSPFMPSGSPLVLRKQRSSLTRALEESALNAIRDDTGTDSESQESFIAGLDYSAASGIDDVPYASESVVKGLQKSSDRRKQLLLLDTSPIKYATVSDESEGNLILPGLGLESKDSVGDTSEFDQSFQYANAHTHEDGVDGKLARETREAEERNMRYALTIVRTRPVPRDIKKRTAASSLKVSHTVYFDKPLRQPAYFCIYGAQGVKSKYSMLGKPRKSSLSSGKVGNR